MGDINSNEDKTVRAIVVVSGDIYLPLLHIFAYKLQPLRSLYYRSILTRQCCLPPRRFQVSGPRRRGFSLVVRLPAFYMSSSGKSPTLL